MSEISISDLRSLKPAAALLSFICSICKRAFAVKYLLLPLLLLLGFRMPLPINNDESLHILIAQLAAHEETALCADWAENHAEFIESERWEWAAVVGGNIIFYPPVVNQDPYTASILVHEILHNLGYDHPVVYNLQLYAIEVLKAGLPATNKARAFAANFADFNPTLPVPRILCKHEDA